jgi:hypothetical protein
MGVVVAQRVVENYMRFYTTHFDEYNQKESIKHFDG